MSTQNLIKVKRSNVLGKVPTISDLEFGEIAINTADGYFYIRKDDGYTGDQIIRIANNHNLLSNISGGSGIDGYFHITNSEHAWLTDGYIQGKWIETKGGTNQTSYATGDLLYASGTNALSKLSIGTDGYVLTVSGNIPEWKPSNASSSYTAGTGIDLTDNIISVVPSDISHGSLIDLDLDDHTQYVHISEARLIDAVHTFDPNSVTAPFALGSNASGQLISGLNSDLLDGYHASDLLLSGDETPTTINAGDQSDYGVSPIGARSDHRHEVNTAAANDLSAVDARAAYAGESDKIPRADHRHMVSVGIPVAVGTGNLSGSQDTLARSDHIHAAMQTPDGEPLGFENRTTSALSFIDAARQFRVTTVGISGFTVWGGANYKYTKTDGYDYINIANTVGNHFIYYVFSDAYTASLQEFSSFQGFDTNKVFVAIVSWNGSKAISVNDERHGVKMDNSTHAYLHYTIGTRYQQGLAAQRLATGTGSADGDAQISITGGTIWDEDIDIVITTPYGASTPFSQNLGSGTSTAAYIPVFYRTGTGSDNWTKDTATTFPVKPSGAAGTRIGYNLNTAGTWSVADAGANNTYIAMWVFGTDSVYEPVIALMGQRYDSNLANAQTNNTYTSLSFGNLPFQEVKLLYRILFKTALTYGNAIKAYIEEIQDYRSTSTVPSGTYVATEHSTLTGLTAANQHPASSIYTDTTNFNVLLSTADTTVQLALDTLDNHTHTQYVRITNSDTITAQHVFNPTNQAPFAVGASADGYLVSGLNSDKLDGYHASTLLNQNAFSNIAVSGQTTISATSETDTLTLANGTAIAITTSGKTATIAYTGHVSTSVSNTGLTSGTTTVDSFADTDCDGCHWKYVVKSNGVALRTGTIMGVWEATSDVVEYTETATKDIGDTSMVTFALSIVTNTITLSATITGAATWSVKLVRSKI